MQFTNAQSPGSSRRAQAVEAIGRETQAETLSHSWVSMLLLLSPTRYGKESRLAGGTRARMRDRKKAQTEMRKLQVEDQKHKVTFSFLFLLSLTAKFVTLLPPYTAFFMKSNVLLDFLFWSVFICAMFDLTDKTSICIIMSSSATVNMCKTPHT